MPTPLQVSPDGTAAIEPASLRDLGNLRVIERICFPKDAWPLLDLISVLTYPGVIRLKAVKDGQMVGFIAGDVRRSEGVAWIATLAVLPEFRQQGIGSALLRVCEAQVPLSRIRLCVRLSNQVAIRLYEARGYGRVGEWASYYQDGESALVMEKNKPVAVSS